MSAEVKDDLVTDDMISIVVSAIRSKGCRVDVRAEERLAEALRAVAPMIATRATKKERDAARAAADKINTAVEFLNDAEERLREAAAIRARGET
jgi:hypothetical protein